jgi:hypothetical protein
MLTGGGPRAAVAAASQPVAALRAPNCGRRDGGVRSKRPSSIQPPRPGSTADRTAVHGSVRCRCRGRLRVRRPRAGSLHSTGGRGSFGGEPERGTTTVSRRRTCAPSGRLRQDPRSRQQRVAEVSGCPNLSRCEPRSSSIGRATTKPRRSPGDSTRSSQHSGLSVTVENCAFAPARLLSFQPSPTARRSAAGSWIGISTTVGEDPAQIDGSAPPGGLGSSSVRRERRTCSRRAVPNVAVWLRADPE